MKILRELYLTNLFFWCYGVALAIVFLGYFHFYLIYAGVFCLLAIMGWTIYQAYALFRLNTPVEMHRSVPKHFSLHDENPVDLKVINHCLKPLQVRLIDELPFQFQVRDFCMEFTLLPEASWEETYQVKPIKRGEYSFGAINLFIALKNGFIERRIQQQEEQKVKVYPSFMQMRKTELMVFSAERSAEGLVKIRKRGHGLEFSEIKHYTIGDDPRTINWKATGRKQELMVNNYQMERSQQVYAVIDHSRVMHMPFDGLNLLDYSINASLSLLNIVLRNGDHAGLMTFSNEVDTFISAKRRAQHKQLLLDALYHQEETTDEPNYQELYQFSKRNLKGRSLLLLFTHFLSLEALSRNLAVLKRLNRSHLLVVIFFHNTELQDQMDEPVKSTMDIAANVMAKKLLLDTEQMVVELRKAGIQTIKTKPEELSTHVINKYLELKAQGYL